MSDHSLSPNPAEWPRDPYRLLGVQPGVNERELKRAYLHLVRRYKPEHAPDEFRRIREAYESVRSHSELHGMLWRAADPPKAETEEVLEQWDELPPSDPWATAAKPSHEHPVPRPIQTPDELWQLACEGNAAEAYRGLRALWDQGDRRQEVFVQLYWLLVVLPELDPVRQAHDWLVRGLVFDASSWRARELLRRELLENPATALGTACARLLARDVRPDLVLQIAESRWRAAASQGRWELIRSELGLLRPWMVSADETTWVRLLITAATRLAWADSSHRSEATTLYDEVQRHYHLHNELADELHQLDFALNVASVWHAFETMSATMPVLHTLMPVSWDGVPSVIRPLLRPYVEQLARQPFEALAFCDSLVSRAPAVFSHLTGLLADLRDNQERPEDERDPEELGSQTQNFLSSSHWRDYPAFRPRLLAYCLKFAIAPDAIAGTARAYPKLLSARDMSLADVIEGDWALRHVYLACECSSDEPLVPPPRAKPEYEPVGE
jgi:hypothetical protein